MNIQRLPMVCMVKKCGHEFDGEIVVGCPLRVACAVMRELRCPKCGSKRVGIKTGKERSR